ncbi:MAG: hypothetical protein JKY98_11935 [Gammaproteobacteria bacterium]|nr:hypothetical protein [Gammaproteobacteria bacterium]
MLHIKIKTRPVFKLLTLLLSSALLLAALPASAQTYSKGQHLEPAYEGWFENDDGTFTFMFGYFNENWKEELDIPVGENNSFSPGDSDRGQPTHFLPRRNRFTFEVVVPADWGDRELVWTVTSPNGETRRAYATIATDYVVDNLIIASETGSLGAGTSSPESRAYVAPTAELIGDGIRTVRVGQPLSFQTHVADDGIPKQTNILEQTRQFLEFAGQGVVAAFLTEETVHEMRLMRPPFKVTVQKMNGLFLSWNVYRGPGNIEAGVQDLVEFDPPQIKPWEDTRTSANSPWGGLWLPPSVPEDGMYDVSVTFKEPGTYILWGRADDGGLYHDLYMTVSVTE